MCVCCVGGRLLCPGPAVSWCMWFFQHSLYFSFVFVFFKLSYFFSLKILRNAKFPKIYDGVWKPNKKQHPNNFSRGSPWPTLIRNSMVCLWGPLVCPAASWGFFERFLLSFSFANVFSFNFLVSFIWNSQKCIFSKIYDALLKSN